MFEFCKQVTDLKMEDVVAAAATQKSSGVSATEDEKDKVKDFVFKHFREVTDGPLFAEPEENRSRRGAVPQRAVFSGKVLSFGCSLCKNDNSTFSPNDLLKHFRSAHQGSVPSFPCDLCDFVTDEFPALQRHRIEHRNTLVTCELCDNSVQYSLLLLTRHYMMCHSVDGRFRCDRCQFATADAGTFVQHIHRHNESRRKCSERRHVGPNQDERQRQLKAHAGKFPFTCQLCGFGAPGREAMKVHLSAAHRNQRRNSRKLQEETLPPPKISRPNNQNGRLPKPEPQPEEGGKTSQSCEESTSQSNGLTVLMVKNKISLPPHCTTKVMGFKMVDGKKHLVLKVIPAGKPERSDAPRAENGARPEKPERPSQEEIVKVKIEEEETSVSEAPPPSVPDAAPRRSSSLSSQEVFSFHNYSKETFSTLLSPVRSSDSTCSERSEDEKASCEPSEFSLTLAESPERPEDDEEDAVVTGDSALRDLNIIKVEEDGVPVSDKPPESGGETQRTAAETPAKTTLRILQLADGKQLAVPLQVKAAAPAFKLLADSSHPRINVSALNAERPAGRGRALFSALNSSNRFLINSPVILAPQSKPADKTKAPQMCYLVQRPPPPLNAGPVLENPPAGRQAFLLRYVSPHKAAVAQEAQSVDASPGKVILKIVSPGAAPNAQPLLLAARPQTKCFLVSPNKPDAAADGPIGSVKTLRRQEEEEELSSAPPPLRPPSQRKRRRKALFDELPLAQKLRKPPVQSEREEAWKPTPKDEERILRLAPFSAEQRVKCPRRFQPVVVLNHPDADAPEVAGVMKAVGRHGGAVAKVTLCPQTVRSLTEPGGARAVQSSVQERFRLKLRLRRKSKKKYQVVKSPGGSGGAARFRCWFCGRIFHNQEDWVGHGQRHLMEATRDWNKHFT